MFNPFLAKWQAGSAVEGQRHCHQGGGCCCRTTGERSCLSKIQLFHRWCVTGISKASTCFKAVWQLLWQ